MRNGFHRRYKNRRNKKRNNIYRNDIRNYPHTSDGYGYDYEDVHISRYIPDCSACDWNGRREASYGGIRTDAARLAFMRIYIVSNRIYYLLSDITSSGTDTYFKNRHKRTTWNAHAIRRGTVRTAVCTMLSDKHGNDDNRNIDTRKNTYMTFPRRVLKKIKSRKGAAEAISFTVSIVFMLAIFLYMLTLGMQSLNRLDAQKASQAAARMIVVSESLGEAGSAVSNYLQSHWNGKYTGTVAFNPEGKQEWEKGALIDVTVTSPHARAVTTVMLEYMPEKE